MSEMDDKVREAMADPEKITVVVHGRNGHRVEINIPRHERSDLTFEMSSEQDVPEYDPWLGRLAGPPAWLRHTFTVETRPHYSADDLAAFVRGEQQ